MSSASAMLLALAEIRDSRLYRETHASFAEYLGERWGKSRANGDRAIEAARIADVVSPVGDIANERQARELVPLLRIDEAEVVEVWEGLVDRFGDRVTSGVIRQAVFQKLLHVEEEERREKVREQREEALKAYAREHDCGRIEAEEALGFRRPRKESDRPCPMCDYGSAIPPEDQRWWRWRSRDLEEKSAA